MRRLIATSLVLALLVTPLSAQTEATNWYRATLAAAVTGHGIDLSTTVWCVAQGTCVEANPMLRWAQDSPVALGGAKMAFAAGTLWLNDYLRRKGWRRAAILLNLAHAVVFTAIGVRNARFAQERGGR